MSVYIVNDQAQPIHGMLYYTLMRMDGTVINTGSTGLDVEAFTSFPYTTLDLNWFLTGLQANEVVLAISITDGNGRILATRNHIFSSPGKLALQQPEFTVTVDDSAATITISANTFAKGVYINTASSELKLSDNYFDLLPNTPKQISLQEIPEGGIPSVDAIRVKSLYSILNPN